MNKNYENIMLKIKKSKILIDKCPYIKDNYLYCEIPVLGVNNYTKSVETILEIMRIDDCYSIDNTYDDWIERKVFFTHMNEWSTIVLENPKDIEKMVKVVFVVKIKKNL
jgi:hypothetical protein